MLSHKMDFNCCANRNGFRKSSHKWVFNSLACFSPPKEKVWIHKTRQDLCSSQLCLPTLDILAAPQLCLRAYIVILFIGYRIAPNFVVEIFCNFCNYMVIMKILYHLFFSSRHDS